MREPFIAESAIQFLSPLEIVYCCVVMVLSYALRGSTGFGAAAAMPLLALIIPLKVLIPAWTLIGLTAGVTLLGRDRAHIAWGDMARLLPTSLIGIAVGLYVFTVLDARRLAQGMGGLILLYGGWRDFRASWVFILVGHVIFTMPFMVRSVMAVFATVDIKTLDEGAASLGASPWRRFRDVIVPNALSGILAGSLMVVTLSLGEFNLTWMLHTPLTKTLPIGLADSYASMRLEVASAYTLIFFVMIIPLLVAMQLFAEKEQKR